MNPEYISVWLPRSLTSTALVWVNNYSPWYQFPLQPSDWRPVMLLCGRRLLSVWVPGNLSISFEWLPDRSPGEWHRCLHSSRRISRPQTDSHVSLRGRGGGRWEGTGLAACSRSEPPCPERTRRPDRSSEGERERETGERSGKERVAVSYSHTAGEWVEWVT